MQQNNRYSCVGVWKYGLSQYSKCMCVKKIHVLLFSLSQNRDIIAMILKVWDLSSRVGYSTRRWIKAWKPSHFLCLNTLESVRCCRCRSPGWLREQQWDPFINALYNSCWERSRAERASLTHRARSAQTMLCPSSPAVVGEELAVDATLPAGITSSVSLVTPSFGVKSLRPRFDSGLRLFFILRVLGRRFVCGELCDLFCGVLLFCELLHRYKWNFGSHRMFFHNWLTLGENTIQDGCQN